MSSLDHVVFLKFGAYQVADLSVNTIPLKVTSVTIATNKTIPSVDVPLSGALSGESITAALDLGMASKSITLQGFITDTVITKTWEEDDATTGSKIYTPIEVAQMIHSSVDSTGLQPYQSVNELLFLYDSKVDEKGRQRGVDAGAGTSTSVPFPTASTDEGLKGFIRNFDCTIDSETIDISFSMTFEIAKIFPNGKIATTIADAIS